MFEHFDTPEEIFSFKLGSTLTAERDGVAVLETLSDTAQHDDLKQLLREHAVETRHQAQNIEQVFRLLGEDESTAPAPAAKGLAKEGEASIRKTDESIVDATVIAAALENEHWEIGAYEVLVANAEARGADEAARLLRENLDQEVAASRKLHDMLEKYSREGYGVGGSSSSSPTSGATGGAVPVSSGSDAVSTGAADPAGIAAAERAGA